MRSTAAGRQIGPIRGVALFEDEVEQLHAVVVADLTTHVLGSDRFFGGTAIALGASIRVPVGDGAIRDLTVRQTTAGVRFKGEPIRPGSTVTLVLGSITVNVQVVSV